LAAKMDRQLTLDHGHLKLLENTQNTNSKKDGDT
jgi:hypothetical protein